MICHVIPIVFIQLSYLPPCIDRFVSVHAKTCTPQPRTQPFLRRATAGLGKLPDTRSEAPNRVDAVRTIEIRLIFSQSATVRSTTAAIHRMIISIRDSSLGDSFVYR